MKNENPKSKSVRSCKFITMGSAKEHSADEAGGEAVFSSDGLPSLSTPLPPPVVISSATAATGSSQGDDDNADAVIEESGVGGDVMDVFESFNVNTTKSGGGWSGLSKLGDYKDNNLPVEDPRRTLFRLRAEVDRLESSFAAEGQTSTSDANDEQYQLQQLKSRLETMLGENASDDVTLDKLLRGRQEDLSRVITNDLQILSKEAYLWYYMLFVSSIIMHSVNRFDAAANAYVTKPKGVCCYSEKIDHDGLDYKHD